MCQPTDYVVVRRSKPFIPDVTWSLVFAVRDFSTIQQDPMMHAELAFDAAVLALKRRERLELFKQHVPN
jgi:hypothetical protein